MQIKAAICIWPRPRGEEEEEEEEEEGLQGGLSPASGFLRHGPEPPGPDSHRVPMPPSVCPTRWRRGAQISHLRT